MHHEGISDRVSPHAEVGFQNRCSLKEQFLIDLFHNGGFSVMHERPLMLEGVLGSEKCGA